MLVILQNKGIYETMHVILWLHNNSVIDFIQKKQKTFSPVGLNKILRVVEMCNLLMSCCRHFGPDGNISTIIGFP